MVLHPSDRSDAELVALCIEGDGRAWEVLVRRYRRLVWSIALTRGLREDEAEDAFQETWLRATDAIHPVRLSTLRREPRAPWTRIQVSWKASSASSSRSPRVRAMDQTRRR